MQPVCSSGLLFLPYAEIVLQHRATNRKGDIGNLHKNKPERDFLTYFRIVDSFFIFSPQEELS